MVLTGSILAFNCSMRFNLIRLCSGSNNWITKYEWKCIQTNPIHTIRSDFGSLRRLKSKIDGWWRDHGVDFPPRKNVHLSSSVGFSVFPLNTHTAKHLSMHAFCFEAPRHTHDNDEDDDVMCVLYFENLLLHSCRLPFFCLNHLFFDSSAKTWAENAKIYVLAPSKSFLRL